MRQNRRLEWLIGCNQAEMPQFASAEPLRKRPFVGRSKPAEAPLAFQLGGSITITGKRGSPKCRAA